MRDHIAVSEPLEARRLLSVSLFKDINATQAANDGAGLMVSAGAVTYFWQDDGVNGAELWKSDGTAAGSVLVKDINPGPADAKPSSLTVVGNTLFFTADDGTNGVGIWKTDGTSAGTQLVKAVKPGGSIVGKRTLWAFNGAIYFGARDGGFDGKLWRSDGTAAGTIPIKDLPAAGSTGIPDNFIINNGALFFTTTNQLWKTDGTTAGTTLVKAIAAGGSGTVAITAANGFVYLGASDGVNGYELWKSDGTAANTVMVKDIVAGSTSSFPSSFAASGNLAYFSTSSGPSGLWRTDGTAAGTFAIGTVSADNKFNLSGTLFCTIGNTLQKTAGTTLTVVKSGLSVNGGSFGAVNGFLYFSADDGTGAGAELWRTNGTTTTLVKDIISGSTSSSPGNFTPIGTAGAFLLMAQTPSLGGSLYKSDGTATGTVFVKDLNPATNDGSPRNFVVFNNAMYFSGNDGINSSELWKTDGTAAGTVLVKDINQGASYGSSPRDFAVLGPGKLFFRALENANGYEPYITDGTAAGTKLIKDINPGIAASTGNVSDVVVMNGVAYFLARDGVNGEELWRSDGTAAGTFRLSNVNPNLGTKILDDNLLVWNEAVYFVADRYLWRSDGTVNGTARVTATAKVASNSVVASNGFLYFGGHHPTAGDSELYISDGTAANTRPFIDLNGEPEGSDPDFFMPMGDKVLFGARKASTGYELFVTDGTTTGTGMVKDMNPGTASGFTPNVFSGFVAANGVAYFGATDGTHGVELWRSDGTAAGTFLVKDIVPGSGSGGVSELTASNGYAYFIANDGTHGVEAWRTDGTTAGTAMLADLRVNNDGALGYDPEGFTAFKGDVYFSATDDWHGKELFRADAPAFAAVAGNVLIISGTGGDDAIDVTLVGGTYTITLNGLTQSIAAASFSSIVINGLTGDDLLRTSDATGRPITFNGAAGLNTIDVRSGVATFNSDVQLASEAVNLTVRTGATARFGSTQHIAELRIESGASATMLQNGGRILFVDWFEIATTGRLDLADNDLVDHNPYVPVEGYIQSAYNFGGWDGPGGIFSSAAKTNPLGNTTLGLLPAWEFQWNNGGLFNGYAPADSDVLVKYTYFGDVDFNGRVDVSDYNLIDYGFYINASGWANGDADYSGGVDASDYNIIDFAFSTQNGVL